MILPRESKPSTSGNGRRIPFLHALAFSAVLLVAVTRFAAVFNRREEPALPRASVAHCDDTTDAPPTTKLSSSSPPAKVPPLNIGRKKGSRVIMNIGSNKTPIGPRREDGPCASTIAFEPIVPNEIMPRPDLHVIPAAVTGDDHPGMASMRMYNKAGMSSSLSAAAVNDAWTKTGAGGQIRVVPTIPMKTVMESLRDYEIEFIMTDMQGYDFPAVSSVLLKEYGVKRIMTEVFLFDEHHYEGVDNDLCWDWWPEMKRQGYVFEGLLPERGGYGDQAELDKTCEEIRKQPRLRPAGSQWADALWRHPDLPAGTSSDYEFRGAHKFSDKEYAGCAN